MSQQSNSKVPDFLRGIKAPVNRAGGGNYGVETPPPHASLFRESSFGNNASYGGYGKSAAPAPMKFGTDAPPAKELPSAFSWASGAQESVASDWGSFAVPSLSPASALARDYTSDEDEEPDFDRAPRLPHVSFESTASDMSEVLRNVASAMETDDYTIQMRSLVGSVANNSGRCKFSVRVSQTGPRHIAEFQRVSGCARVFSSHLSATADGMSALDSISDVRLKTAASEAEDLCAAPEWEDDQDEALDEPTCTQLVGMCASEFLDVRQEALSTVATLSSTQAAAMEKFSAPELRKIILEAADAWAASTLAVNMCQVPEFAKDALLLLPVLFAWLSKSDLATQRNAARALVLVSAQRSDLMEAASPANAANYQSILESVRRSCSDSQLLESLQKL